MAMECGGSEHRRSLEAGVGRSGRMALMLEAPMGKRIERRDQGATVVREAVLGG
jgi:hypothetical protein